MKKKREIITLSLILILVLGHCCLAMGAEKEKAFSSRYRLIGTAVKDNPDKSQAIIRDKLTGKDAVYKIGQVLYGHYIVRIKRAEVHLLREGKILSLGLPLGGGSEFIIIVSDSERLVNRTALNERYKNLNDVFKVGFAFPHIEAGKIRGLKVVRINDDELAQLAGIKEGDIIISVNGKKLKGVKQALEVYGQIKNEAKLKVKLERDGKIYNYNYYMNWEGGSQIPELLKKQQL